MAVAVTCTVGRPNTFTPVPLTSSSSDPSHVVVTLPPTAGSARTINNFLSGVICAEFIFGGNFRPTLTHLPYSVFLSIYKEGLSLLFLPFIYCKEIAVLGIKCILNEHHMAKKKEPDFDRLPGEVFYEKVAVLVLIRLANSPYHARRITCFKRSSLVRRVT